ncbi:MAG: NAD(P)/FAD-dependent oxidoreductase [Candidatus Omnitrophica bacterium]|nr:NAD(P)/FAD-dependent oxidoreductase [Candidatus Omnitrophota bacterium]
MSGREQPAYATILLYWDIADVRIIFDTIQSIQDKIMKRYDVIVVGAGPAGSMAGHTAAKAGLSVLLIDRKISPGTPKECAEGIGLKSLSFLNMRLEDRWISSEYDSIITGFLHGGKVMVKTGRTRGYVLNRKIFDHDLAMKACDAGAERLFGTSVSTVSIGDTVTVSTTKGDFTSGLIIASDGPQSRIARQCRLGTLDYAYGIQHELEGACDLPHTLQTLWCPGLDVDGYCWIFPKKNSVNIGLADSRIAGLKPKLERFIAETGFSSRRIVETNAGLIPCRKKLKRLYSNRLLVAGDAGGLANPITGSGIPAALYSGLSAGKTAVHAIKSGRFDEGSLSSYQRIWDESPFNKAWEAGLAMRAIFARQDNLKKFDRALSKMDAAVITGRKDLVNKLWGWKFSPGEMILFYRLGTRFFDKVIDYAA